MHHGIRIQDNALVASAILSNRYISDRFLPDKAIDLVDEACAMIRTEIDSMPAELDETLRRVRQLEVEETALKKEQDRASKDRLVVLKKELAELKDRQKALTLQWENEKQAIQKLRLLREQIEKTKLEIETLERQGNLEKVAELRYGKLPELEKELKAEEKKAEGKEVSQRLLREEVTEDEIAEIVSRWAGIPVTRLMEGEREKLLRLEEILHRRVVGQDEAVSLVANAVCGRGRH